MTRLAAVPDAPAEGRCECGARIILPGEQRCDTCAERSVFAVLLAGLRDAYADLPDSSAFKPVLGQWVGLVARLVRRRGVAAG